ncbi:MAG: hypothetical protein AAF432_14595 [Planctomycetota bacterium]
MKRRRMRHIQIDNSSNRWRWVVLCISTAVFVGCDGSVPAELNERDPNAPPPPGETVIGPTDPDDIRSSSPGGRRSTLGKALDSAENVIDDYEQKSKDLADEFDDLNR